MEYFWWEILSTENVPPSISLFQWWIWVVKFIYLGEYTQLVNATQRIWWEGCQISIRMKLEGSGSMCLISWHRSQRGAQPSESCRSGCSPRNNKVSSLVSQEREEDSDKQTNTKQLIVLHMYIPRMNDLKRTSQVLMLCLTPDLGDGKELIIEGQLQRVGCTAPIDFLIGGKMCKSCALVAVYNDYKI